MDATLGYLLPLILAACKAATTKMVAGLQPAIDVGLVPRATLNCCAVIVCPRLSVVSVRWTEELLSSKS